MIKVARTGAKQGTSCWQRGDTGPLVTTPWTIPKRGKVGPAAETGSVTRKKAMRKVVSKSIFFIFVNLGRILGLIIVKVNRAKGMTLDDLR